MIPRLSRRPEILQAVSVYLPVHVGYRVVDDLVSEFAIKPFVGLQRIAVERRSRFHILTYQRLQLFFLRRVYDLCANLAAAFQNRRNDSLTFSAARP